MFDSEVKSALLVRHPAPFPTESLYGYILRLSEENGYSTPRNLFLLAGMEVHEFQGNGIRVTKLVRIINRSQAEIEPLAYRRQGDKPRACQVLGHLLRPDQLALDHPRLCPECVAENGFIQAQFDLALMTGCPVHGKRLLSTCPKCGKRLTWFRRGLLECRCGGSLSIPDLAPLSVAELDLLDLLRRKTLGLPPARENASGLPQSHLQVMELSSFLALVFNIGNHSLAVEGNGDRKTWAHIVAAAAHVFENWPDNFFALLEKVASKSRRVSRLGVSRGSLVGIYRSLFKPTWIRVVEQSNFLRVAFFDFLTNHWRSRLVDKRSKGVLPTLCRSRRKYLMIGSPGLELCPSSPGKIYTKRQAAAMIGVSVGVLKSLRATDDFEVSDLPTTKAGFHGRDIEAFIQKLKRLVHSGTTNESLPECITFAGAVREWYGPVAIKTKIVKAILSGQLPVIGNTSGSASGLLIPEEDFRLLAKEERIRAKGNLRTPAEACRRLGCSYDSLVALFETGLLRGIRTRDRLRIEEESINEFRKKFCSLGSVAQMIGTSSRSLVSFCNTAGIQILVPKGTENQRTQAFARIEDRPRLSFQGGKSN